MARSDALTARQRRFVGALLGSPTVRAAADAAGISERTGWRYIADAEVKRALSQALDSELAHATRRAVTAMTGALQTLEGIHKDPGAPTGARVSAARTILDVGPKLREALDLAERVARLEEQFREGLLR